MIYGRVHNLLVRLYYDGDDDAKPQTNQVTLKKEKTGSAVAFSGGD